MKTVDLYIFDGDARYLSKLGNYLASLKDTCFSVKTYSKAAGDCTKRSGIFLVSEQILSGNEGFFEPERTIVLYDDKVSDAHSVMDCLYKYQTGDRIYRKLADFCAGVPGLVPGSVYKGPGSMEVLGIYSPDNRSAGARLLSGIADRYRDPGGVLCLDLTELPEDTSGSGSLQEVLYAAEERSAKLKFILAETAVKRHGADVLDTGSRPLDVRDLTREAWERLLDKLNSHTDYGAVVFLFDSIPTDLSVLELCSELYIPVSSGDGRRTADRFRAMLKASDGENIACRIRETEVL